MVEGVVGGGVGGERGGGGVAVGLGVGRRDRHQDGQRQKGLWGKREGLRVGGKRGRNRVWWERKPGRSLG